MRRSATSSRILGFAGVALAAILAFGVFAPSMSAYANDNNHTDTWYSSYAVSRDVTYTDSREKRDDSSSWDACWYGPNHTVEVAACPNDYWEVIFVGSPIYGWWADKSGYLTNFVQEEGYRWALLWFNNTNSYDTTFEGYWSPDSV